MSPLLRPIGPLAPHVYWLRRVLVLVALALLVFGGLRIVGIGDPADDPDVVGAADRTPSPALTLSSPRDEGGVGGGSSSSDDQGSDAGADAGSGGGGDAGGDRRGGADTPSGTSDRTTTRQVADDGTRDEDAALDSDASGDQDAAPGSLPVCLTRVMSISVQPEKGDVESGSELEVVIDLENTGTEPCRVELSPRTLQVHVVSGEDRIWDSSHCRTLVPTRSIALEPREARPVSVAWSGTRSAEDCPDDQPVAKPGEYLVQAALGDLVSAPSRLRVT